jgi:hypothetical protein
MRISLRTARILWILLGAAESVHVLVSPEHHDLWPVFRRGALGWWNGRILYSGPDYFRYSPVFAALLSPLAALPWVAGNILFDLGGLALLFHAIRRLTRVVFPAEVLSRNEPAILILSLAGIIRSEWSSQAHTWSAALVFLAAAALVEERWWLASFALALAVHLKLSPIVLAGIVAALWPRKMSARLLLALGAWTALPWAAGRPARVLGMYRDWLARLGTLTTLRLPGQRDLLHLFEIVRVPLPLVAYRGLQVVGGLLVLLWALRLRRRCAAAAWIVGGAFAVTIAYMLAMGPAVEFAQYPLLAPWVSAALLAGGPGSSQRLAPALIYLTTMVAGWGWVEDALGRLVASPAPQSLITLGTIAFAVWVILAWRRAPSASTRSREPGRANAMPWVDQPV